MPDIDLSQNICQQRILRQRDAAQLTEEAVQRPPLVWSPLTDGVAKCFTSYVIPRDPERPFGIVRFAGPARGWLELTGREEELTSRGRFVEAAAGLIRDYRISHYWRPDDNPHAAECLLCGAPNPNHPEYVPADDFVQCDVIRQHTLDSPIPLQENRLFHLLYREINHDVDTLMTTQNIEVEF